MTARGEVLVAILNNQQDLELAQEQHWYRIPVEKAGKLIEHCDCWPPKWLAFYQTKVFGNEAFAVNYYAAVQQLCQVSRQELFPDRATDNKREKRYYKLELSPLERLKQPIASQKLRRVSFIPTTWEKFINAKEINDLW